MNEKTWRKAVKSPRMPSVSFINIVAGLVNFLEWLQNKLQPPSVVVLNKTTNYAILSQSISIIAELGIADFLVGGPRHVKDLATQANVHTDALYRHLRVLASTGLFVESPAYYFRLTSLGACLRSDIAGSVRPWARYVGKEWSWSIWGNALESVKNGRSVYENLYGVRFFEWFAQHPEANEMFDQAMTSMSEMVNPAVVAAYNFSSINTLVDLGGGQGSLLALILDRYPHLRGIIFDQPQVIDKIQHDDIGDRKVPFERCEVVAGDFFQSIPAGADAYLMKWILHDWSDEEALHILRTCRQAMMQGTKLLIVEHLIKSDNVPSPGKFLDVAMLTLTGGRERTEAEYRMLLNAAGFKLTRVIPTISPSYVIEGEAL